MSVPISGHTRYRVYLISGMTRQRAFSESYPKSVWNQCALPESRVVKVNADLLAFEALPIYIAITNPFKLGLREEAGGWQKNARPGAWTSVPLFVHCRKEVLASWRQTTVATGKRWFGFQRFKKSWRARHLEPCQNPISGHVYTISVYCDIVPDIGHDILRYDIGTYPILGDTISCHTRYQVYPISGMSRYRDRHP